MGARISSGFTIIETMLFLAVTGLLIAGVLVGTSASVNNQRYRDAVETFKNTLQTQYSELTSIRNDRSNTWTCDSGAVATDKGNEYRGQSNCVIVGRYVTIHGADITAYTVLAAKKASANATLGDLAGLSQNYNYNIISTDVEKTTMEWGTQIAWPASGLGAKSPKTPRDMAFLFMRSPSSGGVYTFSTSTSVPGKDVTPRASDITALMNAEAQKAVTICIAGDGLFVGGDTGVYLNAFATSSSAIEVRSNSVTTETTRC